MSFSSPGKRGKREMIERAARYGVVNSPEKVDHNTLRFIDAEGNTVIRFHNTNILTYWSGGGFVIDTGGFNTTTTRDRLNKFLPPGWRVHTERGTLFLNDTPFDRKMIVQFNGVLVSDTTSEDIRDWKRRIDRFLAIYAARGVPSLADSQGDPWVFTPDSITRDMMIEWMDTGYATRRLVVLALIRAGYSEAGVAIIMGRIDRGEEATADILRKVRRLVREALQRD